MKESDITIRAIADIKSCARFQVAVQQVWDSNDLDIVPAHALITIAKNGGVVLGAYAPEGPPETGGLVGIVLGWPGLVPGPEGKQLIKHCSHQVGVLPGWRGKGIGLRLKLAQRAAVLAQGATEIATWTYDPLQRVNGVFNIHRLGATSNTYIRDVYGELDDAFNVGLPTDRLLVDWRLCSKRVVAALESSRQNTSWPLTEIEVIHSRPDKGGTLIRSVDLRLNGAPLAAPLPDNVVALREQGNPLLLEWRLFLRAVLEQAFAAGYTLVDCIEIPQHGWHYILTLEQ